MIIKIKLNLNLSIVLLLIHAVKPFLADYATIVVDGLDPISQTDEVKERQGGTFPNLKDFFTCSGTGTCVPMMECGENYALEAARRCYNGDKNIFCGVDSRGEPMVCCTKNRRDFETCGKTLVQGRTYKGLGAYPFVVRIGFRNTISGNMAYPCTGSILSRTTILTAAHCALAKSDGFKLSSVRVGDYDASTDPDCSEYNFCAPQANNHRISYIIVHPDYVQGEYHHDIALIVLKQPLNYSVAAQPICLRGDKINLNVGRRATVAGWGKMANQVTRSNKMELLEVPLASWDACQRVYAPTGALKSSKSLGDQLMCVGGEGRDVCQGFGGSPLIVKENGIFWQIAILSFGSDACGMRGTPSVYTGIAHFIDWIRDNTPIE
uniref:CSON000672 protein n=1 Tax=Culicoides sonorensis TaxID=179676 RepID=A0A336KWB3_CULSO